MTIQAGMLYANTEFKYLTGQNTVNANNPQAEDRYYPVPQTQNAEAVCKYKAWQAKRRACTSWVVTACKYYGMDQVAQATLYAQNGGASTRKPT
ncbi:MAG: hypothetical protein WKF84_21950 [Pyrinomonadaceae bacterium]